MSFSSETKPRASLVLLCAAGLATLAGCSTIKQTAQNIWPWGKEQSSSSFTLADEETVLGEELALPELEPTPVVPESSEMLIYWETIRGGFTGKDSAAQRFADAVTGGDYIELVHPVAVALVEPYLYILDDGLGLVVRYNKTNARMERIAEIHGRTMGEPTVAAKPILPARPANNPDTLNSWDPDTKMDSISIGEPADLYVAKDLSFYVTDTYGARVLQYDAKGKLVRILQNKLNMSRPVAVAEDEQTGNIMVADANFDHVLVFTAQGELIGAVGGRGEEPGQFLNITTMATGPDGFYIGARVGQHVQVLSGNGEYLYSLDQTGIVFPYAMAVDQNFHVFLGDYIDNSIKIYTRGKFIASIGRTGVGPGQFKRITDIWVGGDFLYVADSLNGRIQVLRVVDTEPLPVAVQETPRPQ